MIDPQNLAAFAKPAAPMAPMGDEMGMEEDPAAVDKFGELRPALQEFAIEIEECCDELNPEALRDPGAEMDPMDVQILQQGVSQLDPRLQQTLQAAQGITPQEAGDIGMQLESEGLTPDGTRLAGWLYRVGQHGLGAAEPMEENPMEDAEAPAPPAAAGAGASPF